MSFSHDPTSSDVVSEATREVPGPIYTVDGQAINVSTIEETCRLIVERVQSGRSLYICTLNLDHLVKLRSDETFRRVYSGADIVTADGFPIVLLAAIDKVALGRVTGADIVRPLCESAAGHDLPVFIIGPTASTVELSTKTLLALVPGLRIAGSAVPSMSFDPNGAEAESLVRQVKASAAKICFVAVGAPKQEMFSAFAVSRTSGIAFIPVGAALEFLAGTKRRAPLAMRVVGLEWGWRLMSEPRRLFKRYLTSGVLFMGLLWQRRPGTAKPFR